MTFFYFFLPILVMMVGTAFFNAFFAPRLKNAPALNAFPKVSVLIPVRNEEKTIENCLRSLVAQDYNNIEIIVLDDQSTDGTAKIVSEWSNTYAKISLAVGQPLLPDWLGKNWACQQLSEYASGDILIFTDADTWHHPKAVSDTVALMQKYKPGLLSAFPQQITKSLPEILVIPVVFMLVYALLPLQFIYRFRSAAFSAANGQWMAFTRKAYHKLGGHQAVKDRIVEDVEICKQLKSLGLKVLTVVGNDRVFCRMYQSFPEIWQGFSKNLFGIAGNQYSVFFSLVMLLFCACVLPYCLLPFFPVSGILWGLLLINVLLRGILAVAFKTPFWQSVFFHPLGVLLTCGIAINSLWQHHRKQLLWRGRNIYTLVEAEKDEIAIH